MCGILGQVTYEQASVNRPRLDTLQHRGPDGAGEWTSEQDNIYFGHTRLAILDPTWAGRQPMTSASGKFTLTFNGEIYNHLELRNLLPGINWRGSSDTETLVELLADMGLPALRYLKGMFAFALHNTADQSVLLVRDRLGIKPLWFRQDGHQAAFSSEVRSLLCSGKCIPNRRALSEYIAFGHMPNTGEIFEGIRMVPPGSWMRVMPDGTITKGSWWPPADLPRYKHKSRESCVRQVHKLVTMAVGEHLISDVGVGAFLSGGIDSSIVTLVAGKILGQRLKTFTVGFDNDAFDERHIAAQVAAEAGSDHAGILVTADTCQSWVMEAVCKLDLPSLDAINTFIVSKAVRGTGLKVALSGLGGDELFGGYPSFYDVPLMRWMNALPEPVVHGLMRVMPGRVQEKLRGMRGFSTLELTVSRRRFTSINSLHKMDLFDGTPVIPPAPDHFDRMSLISWAEIHGYMIPMLLRDSDQMSMAVGLEIRVPFLDHRLVEEVLGMPQKHKKGRGLKSLLVEAFERELPPAVYNRPKQGFALPMDQWLHGPLHGFLTEGVNAAAELLHLEEPRLQAARFNANRLHWTRVWQWCVLGHWLNRQAATVASN